MIFIEDVRCRELNYIVLGVPHQLVSTVVPFHTNSQPKRGSVPDYTTIEV